jgi:glutathione S-transferase
MIGRSTKKQPEALKTADHNMKLYYSPAACSLAPHIVAREAGLNIELEKVDLRSKKTESGRDYLGINPKGAVPALEIDDGKVLTENAVVLQYLADKSPQMSLPKGMERWRLLELLHFIATELHKGFAPLFDPRTDKERREIVTENLSKRFDILERQLGDKPHLTGEQFTIADAYAYTVLSWSKFHNIDMSRWPKLVAFIERVGARPAVREARSKEGLP